MKPSESFHRTNVTEAGLEIPAERPELRFDPIKHLTAEDTSRIFGELEAARINKDGETLAILAANLKDINPNFSLTPEDIELIGSSRPLPGWENIHHQVNIDLLGLGQAHVSDREFSIIEQSIIEGRQRENVDNLTEGLVLIARLDPARLTISEDDWRFISDELRYLGNTKDMFSFSTIAARIASLDPGRLDLTSEDWELMFQGLNFFRTNDTRSLLIHVQEMNLLAQTEARKKQAVHQDLPAIPETKSYQP